MTLGSQSVMESLPKANGDHHVNNPPFQHQPTLFCSTVVHESRGTRLNIRWSAKLLSQKIKTEVQPLESTMVDLINQGFAKAKMSRRAQRLEGASRVRAFG